VTEPKTANALAIEHGALRAAAIALRRMLGATTCDCGSETGCSCLRDRVEDLHRRLLRHFAAEEALWHALEPGGADWTTLRWIARLERDHDDFRRRTAEVRLELAGTRPSPALRWKLHGILDDLLEHELSEAKLFQRSVFEGRTGVL